MTYESYKELETYVKKTLMVDLFGVADLSPATDYIQEQGGEFLGDFPYGISIGICLSDGIVDQLVYHDDPQVQFTYTFHIYHVVTPRLDEIALLITQKLQRKGYRAFPVTATYNPYIEKTDSIVSDAYKLRSIFSHKLPAYLAGLGWVGKNCLLVAPEFGPRLRLTSVLTDASFPTGEPMEDHCEDCNLCVDICPADALKGRSFSLEEDRDERIDAVKCHHYRRGVLQKKLGSRGCGLCVYVCPYGNPNISKSTPTPKVPSLENS